MTHNNPYLTAIQALDGVWRDRDEGKLSTRFELTVDSRPWSDYARNLRFENTGEDGGSTLTFDSKKPMDHLRDADVRLRIDGIPYFAGSLKRPARAGSIFVTGAVALGPFAAMASQSFGEQVSYSNHYLNEALYDITGRAFTVSGMVEVVGGESIVIEEADFTEETKLMEGARAICDPANFVMLDDYITRRFMRRPRPGAGTSQGIKSYTPDDYEEGAFTIEDKVDGAYSKVVVFRRNESGGYDVREEFPVEQIGGRPAPKNRIYYIADYPGNATQAKQEAYETAAMLIEGEVSFSLLVDVDASIKRWSSILCSRDVERELPRPGLYRELYALTISSGLEIDGASEKMTLSGDGLLVRRRLVEGPKRVPAIITSGSPYVVVS